MEAELYTLIAAAMVAPCLTIPSDLPVSAIVGILYELSDNTNAQFIRPFDSGVHTVTEKTAFVKPPKGLDERDFAVISDRVLSNL